MTPRQPLPHRRVPAYAAVLIAFLALVGSLGLTVAAPASAAPYCGIVWGSLPKQGGVDTYATLFDVRAGRHDCFDRLVLDLQAGASARYSISYVDQVLGDASGEPVPLRGGARLKVVAYAPTFGWSGQQFYTPADPNELVNLSGYRTFRQVALAGSFEGQTTVGLGVRARLPFRAFVLEGPGTGSRLVVDVAHQW